MTAYSQWRERHPQAAADMESMLAAIPDSKPEAANDHSEAWAQQQARMSIARQGAKAWRNNVGGSKVKEQHRCPSCNFSFQVNMPPIRWGLANDSARLNKVVKSSDLILAIPRQITPQMVGTTIAQFGSVETKRPGWHFNPTNPHEVAQANWLQLVLSVGGFACFSTGGVEL